MKALDDRSGFIFDSSRAVTVDTSPRADQVAVHSSLRTLVVEDEPKMAMLLRRSLERDGLTVDVAATGEDALWWAEATAYDTIVLDRMLPGSTASTCASGCGRPACRARS